MRHTLFALAFILAGCGSHHHATATAPPPTPFADIAGHYEATITARVGMYVVPTTAVGFVYDVNIYATGRVTVQDQGHTTLSTYTLTRLPDGSFRTLDIRLLNLYGSLVEYGTAPANLATFRLEADGATNGLVYGTEDFIVVKLAGG